MTIKVILPCALAGLFAFVGSPVLYADQSAEALIADLGSSEFKARAAAKRKLQELCKEEPAVLDHLCKTVFDQTADLEQVLNAKEIMERVVKEQLFVERGSIGISLSQDLKVRQLQPSAPAQKAGIMHQWELTHVGDKEVTGLTPVDVYGLIHKTKPGEKLPLVFKDAEGKDVTVHPVVAPRSEIRSDENVEARRNEFFKEWLEAKRKDLQKAN